MDCQYSSCFLFIQPLLTYFATFADMPRAASGSVSGCKERCLANSFHSHTSWHPYQLNHVTLCKLYQGMMALPDFRVYLEIVSSPNDHFAVGENINVPTFLALFFILHFACLNGMYFCPHRPWCGALD
jgi:hypothetical protein